jgi:hypothetical protein
VLGILVLLLFWPALILSVVVSAVGISHRSSRLLWIGALLSLPTSLYLAATPRFGLPALLLPLCHAAGALLVRRDLRWAAAVPMLVFAGFFGWFGWSVAQQDPNSPLPPGPTVTVGGRVVPVVYNAHCWERPRGNRTCAEGLTAPATVDAKRLSPTVVPAGALLKIGFQVSPQWFQVDRWTRNSDRPETVDLVAGDRLQLPDRPGRYIYSIAAHWLKRGGYWTLFIEVPRQGS